MKSFTCIIEGKVTGGNFQSWVLDAATQLELKGWVRNIANNKAEILVQGTEEAFGALQARLEAEAPVPDMRPVKASVIDYDKEHDHFEIRG